ncbi:AAA family ATPase [Leptospira santarosai]|uniref:AAA domain protein n=1 Tax=Leptospira santarosai TaxID=28183 RepID=A0A2P1QUT7_9LEPT|nr:AAA family ATPase [Leptospira santarosai]AVQ12670.1 AAA domain protein [Leptospira santarosai]EMJ45974.1 AAA domain protein [Leptospira santarosai str. HAI1349]MDI7183327.1 AAA family ATPase [Leptospira santarosai]MDI7228683.1 AAA family ATPase [Leptospira santarosai]
MNVEKSLILLRGLPGTGKSTLAELLSENGRYPVFSVDDYFTDPKTKEYNFDPKKNHLAYKYCEERVRQEAMSGTSKIFSDNTFTLSWEMEPYFQIASRFGYAVFVVTVENYHNGKNIHSIDDESLKKMASKYKVRLLPENLSE